MASDGTMTGLISTAVTMATSATDGDDTGVTSTDHPNLGPSAIFEELQTYSSYRAAVTIAEHKYYYLVPFSLVSNIFCFAVLFKRLGKSTAYLFMANIAIWDAAAIFTRGVVVMVFIYAWKVGDTGCAIIRLFENICQPIAEWLVILLTVDRVIAVWFPFKYRSLCTMPRALVAYAFIVVMIIGVCSNSLWIYSGVYNRPHYMCSNKPEYKEQMKQFLWAFFIFQSLLPTIIVILLNVALVYRLRQNQSRMLSRKKSVRGQFNKMSTENHVTVMALVLSVSFVLLLFPQTVFDIYYQEWDLDRNLGNDAESYATYYVGLTVVYLLVDINHSINVFLYFVSGTRFRSDALQLLMCKGLGDKKQRVIRTDSKLHKKEENVADAGTDDPKKTDEGQGQEEEAPADDVPTLNYMNVAGEDDAGNSKAGMDDTDNRQDKKITFVQADAMQGENIEELHKENTKIIRAGSMHRKTETGVGLAEDGEGNKEKANIAGHGGENKKMM